MIGRVVRRAAAAEAHKTSTGVTGAPLFVFATTTATTAIVGIQSLLTKRVAYLSLGLRIQGVDAGVYELAGTRFTLLVDPIFSGGDTLFFLSLSCCKANILLLWSSQIACHDSQHHEYLFPENPSRQFTKPIPNMPP